jgi:hypothetical protein
MKTIATLLFASVVSLSACKKAEDKAAEPAAKPTEAVKAPEAAKPPETAKPPEAAAPEAAKPPEAKAAEPTTAAAVAGAAMSVDEAGAMAIAITTKLSDAVTSAGTDCAKMGSNLSALQGDLKNMLDAAQGFDKDKAKKKEFEAKFGKQLEESMGKMVGGIGKCKDNADIKAFFKSMD